MAKKKSTKKKSTKKKASSGGDRINYGELSASEKKSMIEEQLALLETASPEEGKAIRVKLRKLGHTGGLGRRDKAEGKTTKKKTTKKKRTKKKSSGD